MLCIFVILQRIHHLLFLFKWRHLASGDFVILLQCNSFFCMNTLLCVGMPQAQLLVPIAYTTEAASASVGIGNDATSSRSVFQLRLNGHEQSASLPPAYLSVRTNQQSASSIFSQNKSTSSTSHPNKLTVSREPHR
jgi:hypothetical protein